MLQDTQMRQDHNDNHSERYSQHFTGSDVEATDASAEHQEKKNDPNVIDWEGPTDRGNPRNWGVGKKVLNIGLVSFMAFLTPLTSSMFAPAVPEVMIEFKSFNIELASFVVSVFVLGFAFGPLVLAPLSEVYGRLPLYWTCNILFLAFVIACAESSDMSMMTGFRFLSGFFGGMPLAVGAGTITDLMDQSSRGVAIAIFSAGPLLGPVVGPIAGGYLAQAKGWRWVFWVVTILSAVCTLAVLLLMSETYAPVILARKVRRLRKSTGNQALRSVYEKTAPKISTTLLHSLIRPMKLLAFSPVVLGLSAFMAFCFGCLFLLFTTFTMVYQEVYGWDMGRTGLSFLGLGVGCCVGMLLFGLSSDRILARKARSSNGEMKPEYRLILLIPTAFLVPIGLFWYGWAAEKQAHWVVPIIGTFWIGVGFLTTLVCISSYLMDAFTEYSASAMAAASLMRSVLGGCLPVAGRQMYRSMGYGWGTSLLGFLSLALAPLPFIFYKYGESLRKRYVVNLN